MELVMVGLCGHGAFVSAEAEDGGLCVANRSLAPSSASKAAAGARGPECTAEPAGAERSEAGCAQDRGRRLDRREGGRRDKPCQRRRSRHRRSAPPFLGPAVAVDLPSWIGLGLAAYSFWSSPGNCSALILRWLPVAGACLDFREWSAPGVR